jgi:hypothetical protein
VKLKKELNLAATKQQLADLSYALAIVRMNQNTQGEPDADKQSVRAYKLLAQLFNELGI